MKDLNCCIRGKGMCGGFWLSPMGYFETLIFINVSISFGCLFWIIQTIQVNTVTYFFLLLLLLFKIGYFLYLHFKCYPLSWFPSLLETPYHIFLPPASMRCSSTHLHTHSHLPTLDSPTKSSHFDLYLRCFLFSIVWNQKQIFLPESLKILKVFKNQG